MDLNKTIQDKRAQIFEVAQKYGVTNIRVFGSIAKNQSHEKSDIDFLIKLRPKSSLLDLVAFKQDLEELLGCHVDVVTEASLSPYLKDEVLKTAVNL